MKIHLSTRHLSLTSAIENCAVAKFGELSEISRNIVSAHVVLGHDHGASTFSVSARLAVAGPDLHADGHGGDLYATIGEVAAKLARQLRKRKTRLTDKRRAAEQKSRERSRKEPA